MASRKVGSRLDSIGMTASTLCAIHCAIVPVLLTFLPLTGLGFLANPLLEWGMIVLALVLGVSSIFLSYFRTHKKALPLLLLLIGFIAIIAGHIYLRGWLEAVVVPLGGLTIAAAHFINFKYVGMCNNSDYFFHIKHNHPKRH
jgi:hypothetical protein